MNLKREFPCEVAECMNAWTVGTWNRRVDPAERTQIEKKLKWPNKAWETERKKLVMILEMLTESIFKETKWIYGKLGLEVDPI